MDLESRERSTLQRQAHADWMDRKRSRTANDRRQQRQRSDYQGRRPNRPHSSMKFQRPDGRTVRPSLVVLDDPQTDESARSLSQCANRESILAGAVLGLAGPGKKISGIMPCTVIRPGDMADNILDRNRHTGVEWRTHQDGLCVSQ